MSGIKVKHYNHEDGLNEYVYDIKQHDHNNDGIYSNIYGKIYIEDVLNVIEMYFGRMRA